jgi:hypothetical protein
MLNSTGCQETSIDDNLVLGGLQDASDVSRLPQSDEQSRRLSGTSYKFQALALTILQSASPEWASFSVCFAELREHSRSRSDTSSHPLYLRIQ